MSYQNTGFDPHVIAEYRVRMNGKNYLLIDDSDASDEYQHFYFIGMHQGKEVLIDTVLCTLRLEHERQLFEIAEQKVLEQFPVYQMWIETDQPTANNANQQIEEEVGLFMAYVMMEIQDEGSVKVQEYVEVVEDAPFGVGIDAALHRESITTQEIEKFIADYRNQSIGLDSTRYSFQIEEDEE